MSRFKISSHSILTMYSVLETDAANVSVQDACDKGSLDDLRDYPDGRLSSCTHQHLNNDNNDRSRTVKAMVHDSTKLCSNL